MNNINAFGKQGSRYLLLLLLLVYILNIGAQDMPDISDINTGKDTLRTVSSRVIYSFKIDTALSRRVYKENFKLIPSKVNIYDMPYSTTANYPNYKRLALNTGVLYGAGFIMLGVLQILPEDATRWNRDAITSVPPFRRWLNNVKDGPVWDKDNFIFNYVLHPYGGAAYYMGARSQGFNMFYSFLYTTFISTFVWEYGFEAFMEIPSIQDLILTPTTGTLMGEGFYLLKRHIVSHGYTLFGSSILGNVVVYLIDPVNEVIGIFAGNPNRKKMKASQKSLTCTPWLNTIRDGKTFGMTISYSF